jgi:glycosyltransferase involved in cell wall biosynthesis
MGEHVRSVWRALTAVGATPTVYDIYAMCARTDPDFVRTFVPAETKQLSRRINIFHINGDEVAQALPRINAPQAFAQAYNIIYPAWELSRYPEPWVRELEKFDEIWAPSAFIRGAIAAATNKPVVHMPLAVDVRMSSFLTRRQLGLPESAFIYLFFFDFTSYLARKNPFAVLDAFEALAERHPQAPLHLVLKYKGDKASGEAIARLKAAMAARPGQIQIIDRVMSDNEVKNLVRAADCFVSLHRAEGFGRGMAEAMALGVPTVATGYSGNLDFMNADTAWLVEHDLVGVAAGEYPQAEGQHWAAPRLESAVALMEQVWLDRAGAADKAARARRHMAAHFAPRALGLRYLERLGELSAPIPGTPRSGGPGAHEHKVLRTG